MSLNYDRSKRKVEEGGTHWTSYSDLFLVLSVVFLLLFAVANLRTGMVAATQSTRVAEAREELENLRKQIKVYEAQRDDYLRNGASEQEGKVYQELLGQLHLLQTEAKTERDKAAAVARTADEKAKALNSYQQLVKNIVTANLVSASRLKKRNEIIENQGAELDELATSVEGQEEQLAANQAQIGRIRADLAREKKSAEQAYKSRKLSRQKYEATIAKLETDNAARLRSVEQQNARIVSDLEGARAQLEAKNREAEQLMGTLGEREAKYRQEMAALEQARAAEVAAARNKGQAALDAAHQKYQAKVDALGRDLETNRNAIKEVEGKYQADMAKLGQANESLKKDLNASLRKLNEQRALAAQIQKNFRGAGLNASIDQKTGDVLINFENEYFDTGSAELKTGMRAVLEKTIPVYAKSLYQDPKIAKRLQSVEIIGFASPTWQGKAVDPSSLSPENRTAVNYNMDLSYRRAKTIFEQVFDTERMAFQHQKDLLSLVKVSGRSYFATEKLEGRGPASNGDFCQQYDCKKSQRVIIKFNLKDE